MSKRYSIAAARQNLAAIVHELEEQPVIELTRRGEPVAVLLSLASYRRLLPEGASFWAAYSSFREAFSTVLFEEDGDAFGDLRDRSPGREVAL